MNKRVQGGYIKEIILFISQVACVIAYAIFVLNTLKLFIYLSIYVFDRAINRAALWHIYYQQSDLELDASELNALFTVPISGPLAYPNSFLLLPGLLLALSASTENPPYVAVIFFPIFFSIVFKFDRAERS